MLSPIFKANKKAPTHSGQMHLFTFFHDLYEEICTITSVYEICKLMFMLRTIPWPHQRLPRQKETPMTPIKPQIVDEMEKDTF